MKVSLDMRRPLLLPRLVILLTITLSGVALAQFFSPYLAGGVLLASRKWQAVAALAAAGLLLEIGLLASSWTAGWAAARQALARILGGLERLGKWNLVLFAGLVAGYCLLLLGHLGRYTTDFSLRLLLFWLVAWAGGGLVWAAGLRRSSIEVGVAASLFTAAGYRAAVFLTDITNYPFTLNWSEGSRYFYASLFFSQPVYGISIPPSVLHPTRYMLQALPFLIPGSPLWLHRAWQVFLWIAVTGVTSYWFARRLALSDRWRFWMAAAWAFMFLLLGPVYYHLQVPLILVLWGFKKDRFWKSLGVVLLASAWAGISRINWFPVPGMLAATLYFLEQPAAGRSLWRYLLPPAVWTLAGTALAFGVQALYMLLSGNAADQFTSSFTSDLLWYRLLPNPTYPVGILLSSLFVSLPLLLLIYVRLAGRWRAYHPIRLLGLGAILLVLFAGGALVSTKIGGGSNLHNLDAYLALLMVTSGYFFLKRDVPESGAVEGAPADSGDARLGADVGATAGRKGLRNLAWAGLALTLLMPVYYTLDLGGPNRLPTQAETAKALGVLRRFTEEAAQQGGPVLFIGERQMETFHLVKDIPLVPDYERVFLMEMVMAGNPEYLGQFHADLKNQRFAMIVSEPLFIQYKGRAESFGEENDAWVNQVSKYVLCYYEPQRLLRDVHVQIFTPRANPQNCP